MPELKLFGVEENIMKAVKYLAGSLSENIITNLVEQCDDCSKNRNHQDFHSAEVKHVKYSRATRESYGDNAVGYVQVRRQSKECMVKTKVTLEHKVHGKGCRVFVEIDEEEEMVLQCQCLDHAASESILNYNLVNEDPPNGAGGVAILIRENVSHKVSPVHYRHRKGIKICVIILNIQILRMSSFKSTIAEIFSAHKYPDFFVVTPIAITVYEFHESTNPAEYAYKNPLTRVVLTMFGAIRNCIGASRSSPCPAISAKAQEPTLDNRRDFLAKEFSIKNRALIPMDFSMK
ncbi:hypothetical protein JTB14_008005 [Gonioctena quinquepunctata]|nr:hypothetical protein JTB14_008005 [Gonioctena quinquepunctata]